MRFHLGSMVVCAAIAASAASACGSGSSPAAPSSSSPPPANTPAPIVITITGQNGVQSFSPNPASAAGQAVVFRNADGVLHRVVLNDGGLDTGDIAPGASSRQVTMPQAGANYHCSLHPGMIGAVNSASGPPPACTGQYCEGY